MNRIPSHFLGLLTFIIIIVLLSPCAYPQERCKQWAGKVVSIQGTVQVRAAGETQWQPAKLNSTYCPGDTIRVLDRSRADLALANRPLLRLDQGTTITLKGVKEEKTSIVELVKGAVHFFSRVTRSLEVETGFVNAGVEGTEFFMRVEEDKTFLSIFEGKVLASNAAGSLILTSGQSAIAEAGKAPVFRVVVRPRDAVQWALYYPPVMYVRPGEPEPREDIGDPRYLAHRASLLISVGRVDEARKDLERALTLNSNYSDAYALQSIMAVVQNEKEKALTLAQKAVETGPNSATARIALSYAQQANLNLEGARKSLEEAVQLSPENALAWARLAEIRLSFAKLGKALEAAQKAVSLNPDLSRTQTVLGFNYLAQVETRKAKEAFQRAIELDQADPLPRLGLGLTKIRDGGWPKWEKDLMKMVDSGLMEGAKDIETAVSLDPDNSLMRSYLGKAYYEKTEGKLATEQFDMAKKLDPKDPTPYFYDAIEKQTTNRPVEALQDFEKAIELNDNRAVYRSKLLLDSDLAARSASVARIYTDLGFQQRALVEGWKSVNTDPADYSGHRFLADTYAALPRHEIARVSELLQSQLLQPLNMTPIQPRLGESNLFLVSAQGPASLSFNEFNPLFSRNGVTFQGSFLGGENYTFGGEGVVSGIYKKLAFSAGYNYFGTDGWRENADQKDHIANVFLQYEFSPQISIQGEYRYRNFKSGDLKLNFFPDDFSQFLKDKKTLDTYRLGLRYAQSPSSIFLGSFMYQHSDESYYDEPTPIATIDIQKKDHNAFSTEIQHLFRSRYVNFTSGLGFFGIRGDEDTTLNLNLPPPPDGFGPMTIIDSLNKDTNHFNLYVYSNISPLKNLTITLGASGDFFDTESSDTESKNQFNPKFGIVWNPFPSTTVRAAAFRVLRRTLITNQTLEPTQVAGFNQFFDDNDISSTSSWRYGGAIDQKFLRNLYGGVEFSGRDLSVPYEDFTMTPTEIKRADWNEYLGRAYLYWTPHPWLALRAAYQYEQFKREEEFTIFLKKLTTHSVPLGASFFHPCGLSASLQATYYHQDGTVFPQGADDFVSGKSDFWLVDAGLNYRLPKRYGLITVGATNLFDKQFKYQETDFKNPHIQPGRMVFARVTLALP